jgi:hypothetical protein
MGLDKLILPDGRNRLGGYMTTASLIGKLTLPDGRNRLVGSVIGNNDGRWDEEQQYASTRKCRQNGKMTLPSV